MDYRLAQLAYRAKVRSLAKGFEYDIDPEYVKELYEMQDGKCCVSGRTFSCDESEYRVNPDAVSLDRIIPKLGYTKGNLRLVTWQVNCAISEFGLDNFLSICQDAIDFNRG